MTFQPMRPRLPLAQDAATPVFALEQRLRRADPSARILVEAHRIVGGDIKRRVEQFALADSTVGLEILWPPRYGVTLSGSPVTMVSHTVAGDGYITDLDTLLPSTACRVQFNGSQDPNRLLRRIIAKLHPANGGAQNVSVWRCELYLATEMDIDTPDIAWALLATVDVTAGPSEADVTFDFGDYLLRPAAFGAPAGTANANPTLYVVIKALQSSGVSATNVGWRRDSTTANVVTADIRIEARSLSGAGPGLVADGVSTDGMPIITVDAQASFAETIIAFTASNKLNLGAVPASASDVVLVVQGERPQGTRITAQARVGGADAWVTFTDGQTAAEVGLAASQTYQIRATLTPTAALDVAPILTDLGVQQVTRTDLSQVATVSGGGWALDPVTLKGAIAEVTITALQDGERDFRDAITDLLSSTDLADLFIRVYVMADDLTRDLWYHVDDFYPDHVEGMGGAMVLRCVSLLGMLKQALPKYDAGTQQRAKLTYSNQTKKAVYADLVKNQIALPDRYIGPMVEAAGTVDTISKEITGSDGKEELDAVAFLAGMSVQTRQGRVMAVDVHGAQGSIQFFGIEDIAQDTVTPGWSQAVPSFFADYDYDYAVGSFRKQHRGFNQEAVTALGQRGLDRVEFLDQEIAKWIPSGPGGDLERYVKPVVDRQITTLGTGMITLDFRTTMAYPELWPGDVVAVRTDRLVAKSPTDHQAIKGYTWVRGVIAERRDVWGTDFRVWVRSYSDILSSFQSVTIDDAIIADFASAPSAGSVPVGSLIAATATNWIALPDVALGNVLLSQGVAVAPAYGKITDSHVAAAAGIAVSKLAGGTFAAGEYQFPGALTVAGLLTANGNIQILTSGAFELEGIGTAGFDITTQATTGGPITLRTRRAGVAAVEIDTANGVLIGTTLNVAGLLTANAGIFLRPPSDQNHGMIYDGLVDGPQFRALGGFAWNTGTAGATARMILDTALKPATAGGLTLGTATRGWGDLYFQNLGRFDSTDTPTEGQTLVYKAGATNKWQAEHLNAIWGDTDFQAAILTDGAATYIFTDPGTGADSPVGAPATPNTPIVTQSHGAHTVELRDYSKPADFRYFIFEYSRDGTNWILLANATSAKVVHSRLPFDGTTFRYRVRVLDRAGNASANSGVAGPFTPIRTGETHAFGAIIAGEIAVANLAAITANIGIITAGQLRNSGNTAGINLGGAGGIPGGWTAGINFEAAGGSGSMTRYLDFAATGSNPFLEHEKLLLNADGTAQFSGQVNITNAQISQTLKNFHILLRDPDVAHGMTALVETDVLGAIGFQNTLDGGLNIIGFTEQDIGLLLEGISTAPGALGFAPMTYQAWKKSGAGRVAVGSTEPAHLWQAGDTDLLKLNGAGDLEAKSSVAIDGGNGTKITKDGLIVGAGAMILKVLSTTATWDIPSTAADSFASLAVTVTGAAVGDIVLVSHPHLDGTFQAGPLMGYVSAADTVTVVWANRSVGTVDPDSRTIRIVVLKF